MAVDSYVVPILKSMAYNQTVKVIMYHSYWPPTTGEYQSIHLMSSIRAFIDIFQKL